MKMQPHVPSEPELFPSGTFHFQLSLGMPPVGPRMVHSDVFQRGLLDDERVLLSIFLESILGIFTVFVELNVLKEPGERISMSHYISGWSFFFSFAS